MSMPWRNISAGAALLAVAVLQIVLASGLPERPVTGTPGPAFFPLLVGVCLVALASVLVLQGLIALRTAHRSPPPASDLAPPLRSFAALACFAAYLLLLDHAGFLLASAFFFAALMRLYGAKSYLYTAAASTGAAFAIYAIFRYGFRVILPRGLLDF